MAYGPIGVHPHDCGDVDGRLLIGCGDKHGENVTSGAAAGETVHVDLNMLFNQGPLLKSILRLALTVSLNKASVVTLLLYSWGQSSFTPLSSLPKK